MILKSKEQINTLIASAYAKRVQLIIKAIMPERLTPTELRLAKFWVGKPIF